jgi:hypothetical protein
MSCQRRLHSPGFPVSAADITVICLVFAPVIVDDLTHKG